MRAGADLSLTSRFSESVWPLEPALLQNQQTALSLNFAAIPTPAPAVTKHLCYTMLSGDLPTGEDRPSLNTVRKSLAVRRFLRWLPQRTTGSPTADLLNYQRHLLATVPSPRTTTRADRGPTALAIPDVPPGRPPR